MYGTVARYRLKPGMEPKLLEFEQMVRAAKLPGLVAGFTVRMDDPSAYYEAVVFESKEAYRAVAEPPAQDARHGQLLALLEAPPEWHDGEVVSADRPG